MKTKTFYLALRVTAEARFDSQWIANHVRQIIEAKIRRQSNTIITEVISCEPPK